MALTKYQDPNNPAGFQEINPDINPEMVKGLTPYTSTPVISAATLVTPSTPIAPTIPPQPGIPDTTGGQTIIDALMKMLQGKSTTGDKSLLDILNSYNAPPSQETAVRTAQTDPAMVAKETAATEAQNKLDVLNAELAGINTEAQAVPIQQEQAAIGRGRTTSQVQALSRGQLSDIALRALAKQSEVLNAQAVATGSARILELAQGKLKMITDAKIADATNTYNAMKDNRDKIWNLLTDAEKAKVAAQQKKDDQAHTDYLAEMNDKANLSQSLMKDDPATAAKLALLDAKSPTYKADKAALMAQAKPTGTGDIGEFKSFFPNVDITTPAGQQQYLDWQMRQAKAKAVSTTPGVYVPGSNPAVDNWAKLIIAGQAKITDVPNPKGSTMRSDVTNAIATSGQLLLSDKDREKLTTLDTAFNVANTIKSLSEKINTFDVVGRVTGYLSRYLGGATQYNVDVARYNAAREGFVSNVARTLGEKGTLAEGDVARAISNLPTINDTKAVAKAKLKTLFSILEGTRTSIIQKSTEPVENITVGTLPAQEGETKNYNGVNYKVIKGVWTPQ